MISICHVDTCTILKQAQLPSMSADSSGLFRQPFQQHDTANDFAAKIMIGQQAKTVCFMLLW